MIKAISFDFYGTLVDWLPIWVEASNHIVNKTSLAVQPDIFALEWRKIQRQMLDEKEFIPYKENISSALYLLCNKYKIKNNNYDKILFSKWKDIKPFPEVIPVLNKLKSKYKLSICTNSSRDLFERCMEKIPVKFDSILISDEIKVNKPHKKIYERNTQNLGFPPKNVLHIASSQMDVRGAFNAGLTVCWVNRLSEEKLIETPKPSYEINDLGEVLNILQSLKQQTI